MFRKLLLALALLIASMGFAFAEVDANKADQAALDSVKGIGPTISKNIIDERKKGQFKDWADFEKRVKGVGDKRAASLSQNGLTINGQAKPDTPAASKDAKSSSARKEAKSDTKTSAKDGKSDTKSDTKADTKSAGKGARKEEATTK